MIFSPYADNLAARALRALNNPGAPDCLHAGDGSSTRRAMNERAIITQLDAPPVAPRQRRSPLARQPSHARPIPKLAAHSTKDRTETRAPVGRDIERRKMAMDLGRRFAHSPLKIPPLPSSRDVSGPKEREGNVTDTQSVGTMLINHEIYRSHCEAAILLDLLGHVGAGIVRVRHTVGRACLRLRWRLGAGSPGGPGKNYPTALLKLSVSAAFRISRRDFLPAYKKGISRSCVFEERVLHCSGDRFERGCQPPLKPLAIVRKAFLTRDNQRL